MIQLSQALLVLLVGRSVFESNRKILTFCAAGTRNFTRFILSGELHQCIHTSVMDWT